MTVADPDLYHYIMISPFFHFWGSLSLLVDSKVLNNALARKSTAAALANLSLNTFVYQVFMTSKIVTLLLCVGVNHPRY